MKLNQALILTVAIVLAAAGAGCANQVAVNNETLKTPTPLSLASDGATPVRVGFFPNITHAQTLVGLARGTFRDRLGSDYAIETKMFNAGPAEIEALYAGEIDIGYVGPSPAVNGFLRSEGTALRIVSGAASGGASFILQPSLADKLKTEGPSALRGKKIASPQQGNTQDVALRHYLRENGLNGAVTIVPMANADQLTAFSQRQLDGSWAPEPWATRLVKEGGGVRAFDERSRWPDGLFSTTNVIVRTDFLRAHPDAVRKWIDAHLETTHWMKEHPSDAKKIVNDELGRITTKKLSDDVLNEAWSHLDFTTDPLASSTLAVVGWAKEEGLLPDAPLDSAALFDLEFLNNAATATHQ